MHVSTVPESATSSPGTRPSSDLRDVEPSDLLERDPVAPDESLLQACIRGKVVMVSGAGGSIGSELCRQIMRLGPHAPAAARDVGAGAVPDRSGAAHRSQARSTVDVEIVPLLGNAHHRNRVREIMQQYRVQTVYHAAAYKHVPIVEQNIIEGIHNNVFSTWYLGRGRARERASRRSC